MILYERLEARPWSQHVWRRHPSSQGVSVTLLSTAIMMMMMMMMTMMRMKQTMVMIISDDKDDDVSVILGGPLSFCSQIQLSAPYQYCSISTILVLSYSHRISLDHHPIFWGRLQSPRRASVTLLVPYQYYGHGTNEEHIFQDLALCYWFRDSANRWINTVPPRSWIFVL